MFPARFLELTRTAEFWSDYFLEELIGAEVADVPNNGYVLLPFGPEQLLRLRYATRAYRSDGWYVAAEAIRLSPSRDVEGRSVAWFDAHSAHHLLRWEEADLFGRYAALTGTADVHPSFPFLLLSKFTASMVGTDNRLGRAMMRSALTGLDVFDERQVACRTPASSPTPFTHEWRYDVSLGWHAHFLGVRHWQAAGLRPVDTLRQPPREVPDPDGRDFLFREWNEGVAWLAAECRSRTSGHPAMRSDTAQGLVRAAVAGPNLVAAGVLADWLDENDYPHATVPRCLRSEDPVRVGWALESLADLPAGEVIGRLVPSNPSHEYEQLELHLQFPNDENAYDMLLPLGKVLYAEGIGTCSLAGCWFAYETEEDRALLFNPAVRTGDEYVILARAELDRVVEAVRRVAAANGNPPVRLYLRLHGRPEPPYRRLL